MTVTPEELFESAVSGANVVRQAVHTVGIRTMTLLCRLGLLVVIGRTLSPADYGAYSLIMTVGAFGVIFSGLNLRTYVYRQVPGLPLALQLSTLKTTFVFEVTLATVLVGILLVSGRLTSLLGFLNATGYESPFALGLILVVLLVATAEMTHFFMAQARIEQANWVDFIGQASWVLPIFALWALGVRITVATLLVAQMTAFVGVAAYAARHIDMRAWWRTSADLAILKTALAFSVPMIVPAISEYSLRLADRFLLSHYSSVRDVGVYSFAVVFVNTLYSFTAGVIFGTIGPRIFAAHNRRDFVHRDILQTYMLKSALVCFGIPCVVLALIAGPLIGLLARPDYTPAVGVMPLLGVSFALLIVGYPAHFLLSLHNRVLLVAALDVVGMIVGIVSNVLLIPRYSYMGAASASVIGFATTTVLKCAWSGMLGTLRLDLLLSIREESVLVRRYVRRLKEAFA